MSDVKPIWQPSELLKQRSYLFDFMQWVNQHNQRNIDDYDALWRWSIDKLEAFWGSFWTYAKIYSHQPYQFVLQKQMGMIGTKWFEGSMLNYAEHVFRNRTSDRPALIFCNEAGNREEISWHQLELSVAKLANWMRNAGLQKGDRVACLLPNIPEAVIACLAAQSFGLIWSSCSPDFGNEAIVDRFAQIEPKLLLISDGYLYNGKKFLKLEAWTQLIKQLPTLSLVVQVNVIEDATLDQVVDWQEIQSSPATNLFFEPLPFDHPMWILYSSGTTGKPKAIVHSVGGILIEHLKVLLLHWDVKPGERFFWYSSTGWMMWNFALSALLTGATLMLYDGSPSYPTIDRLWHWIDEEQIHHVGGGASYFHTSMQQTENIPSRNYAALRTIGSTGSPLSKAGFEWIYAKIKKDIWLISFSGGTDICSGFVGGCPLKPVHAGEIQCALLGVALASWDENGNALINKTGEMVITEPMPSMPLFFWNDENNIRYHQTYFSTYKGVWKHGDWIEITDRQTIIIYGRSDATLNRNGVRIGTAEIYAVVDQLDEIEDSIVIGLMVEPAYRMILFVKLKAGVELTDELKQKIKTALRVKYSPRHVPDEIYSIEKIPYTSNGKKKEIEFTLKMKKELL